MKLPRSVFSEWAWAGGPERRLLLSLLVTLVIVAVPWLAGSSASVPLIALFLGWDLGSWFMDHVYQSRLSQRSPQVG